MCERQGRRSKFKVTMSKKCDLTRQKLLDNNSYSFTKFGMVMDIDDIKVMYEGQGHRSKVKVTISKM